MLPRRINCESHTLFSPSAISSWKTTYHATQENGGTPTTQEAGFGRSVWSGCFDDPQQGPELDWLDHSTTPMYDVLEAPFAGSATAERSEGTAPAHREHASFDALEEEDYSATYERRENVISVHRQHQKVHTPEREYGHVIYEQSENTVPFREERVLFDALGREIDRAGERASFGTSSSDDTLETESMYEPEDATSASLSVHGQRPGLDALERQYDHGTSAIFVHRGHVLFAPFRRDRYREYDRQFLDYVDAHVAASVDAMVENEIMNELSGDTSGSLSDASTDMPDDDEDSWSD